MITSTPINPIPWDECSDRSQARALKLMEALRPSVMRQHDSNLSAAEFERLGCEDYARATGETITPRRFRDVFKRTCRRAGAAADFDNREIYLDDQPTRRFVSFVAMPEAPGIEGLRGRVRKILELPKPPLVKVSRLWDAVFVEYETRIEAGQNAKDARRVIVNFIVQDMALLVRKGSGNPHEAATKNFKRKRTEWLANGRSLESMDDGRLTPERDLPYQFSPEEWPQMTALAATPDNMDLGWREFLDSEHARTETKIRFAHTHRMPAWIRKRISADIANVQPFLRGPRAARDAGAFITRTPSTLFAGDSDQSDDKTPDVLWWDDTPKGVWFGQGQLLPWMDERSWLILSICLIADKNYNGFDIRNSWTGKVRKHGLPRLRVHVERGSWEDSSVWVGRKSRDGDEELGIEVAEEGIRRLGVEIRNATTPRGKLIERYFGSLTDLITYLPGFCGRNQQLDKFESVQKRARLARLYAEGKGGEHPRELGFLHRSQMVAHLEEIAHKLNNTVKRGEYHTKWIGNGRVHLTPTQAYEEFFGPTPIKFIPPEHEHLFQRNKLVRTVGRNGISITHGSRTFTYKNEELGCFKDRELVFWFNPEDTSVIRVTDHSAQLRFAVPLNVNLSHNATPEEIAAASAVNAGFNAYQRDIHRALKPAFSQALTERRFRYPVIPSVVAEFTKDMQAKEETIKTEQRQRTHSKRAARKIGMTITDDVPVLAGETARVSRLKSFMAKHGQEGDE